MATSATAHAIDGAAANAAAEPLPAPRTAQRPTHFAFEHQVFAVKDAWFGLSPSTGEPCYNVPLGDVQASLPLETVASSFHIGQRSTDAQLLQIVKDSLKFVKEIRPGDSIPSELLDGTASWKVEPHHRDIARARISVQLTSWMTGKHIDSIDAAELEIIAANPETKRKVQEALDVMADKLGLTGDAKKDVVIRFEELAREMSYIEALRDRFGKIQRLYSNFGVLAGIHKRERSALEEIMRIRVLMKKPVDEIAGMFEQVDVNTGEIMNTMRKFAAQIRYIRSMRDELHQRFMRWDDLITRWDGVVIEPGPAVDRLIRATYQFVARHFPLANDWGVR
jgi:hypothetical protein